MTGTATGTWEAAPLSPPRPAFGNTTLNVTLTPTSGTGKFANVGGVINLTGTWAAATGHGLGPISGSLTGALTRP